MNSYSSPYSRFGGGGMYGGGGYGSMYGGMGGMGGMGSMGGGMYGGPGMMNGGGIDPNDPNSLTSTFSQSTQATFQVLESLVGAFGGVAQMLESTYMATHSSFFAMVSVAEQFSHLRTTLGSILGIFTLLRYFRTLYAKLTGRPPPADATALTPAAFASFAGLPNAHTPDPNSPLAVTPSKKPFLLFLAAVVGLPYLMTKLIRGLAAQQQQQQQQPPNNSSALIGPDGHPLPAQSPHTQPFDPSTLTFCRALYDYTPPPPLSPQTPDLTDLPIKKGDLVAVLSKLDPDGRESEWWQCRSRDGRVGYLPGVYLEEIVRKREGGGQALLEERGRLRTLDSMIGVGSGVGEGSSGEEEGLKVEARRGGLGGER